MKQFLRKYLTRIPLLALVTYDCGNLSQVIVTRKSTYLNDIDVIFDSDPSQVVFYGYNTGSISFFWSGFLDIDSPLGSLNVFISKVEPSSIFTENILMGLAGVVCASFLGFVFVKHAV